MYGIWGNTDIGLKRKINQDYFKFAVYNNLLWAVVCDGLGGENAGEVASKLAAETISDFMLEHCCNDMDHTQVKDNILNSIVLANDTILKSANEDSKLQGMSTTVVNLIIYDGMVHVANVGDSRAYCICNDTVSQLTKDHSVVQVLLDNGKISKEQACNHPNKNCLVRALGLAKKIEPSYKCIETNDNINFLICTDGLYNYVTKKEILWIAKNFTGPVSIKEFINIALRRGGSDNITAVFIK